MLKNFKSLESLDHPGEIAIYAAACGVEMGVIDGIPLSPFDPHPARPPVKSQI
jgi:hypothetical protein